MPPARVSSVNEESKTVNSSFWYFSDSKTLQWNEMLLLQTSYYKPGKLRENDFGKQENIIKTKV